MNLTTAHSPASAPGFFTAFQQADRTLAGKAMLAVSASLFVALCAHVSVPLPWTPVPLTLSNMGVILVGLALTPATAFAALALYLAEGAAGLPVFNPGAGGVVQLFGVTGGYLFAYPLAAALASFTLRRLRRFTAPYPAAAVAATLGTLLVLICGVTWLATLLHLHAATAFKAGAVPFLPGEVIKIAVAAGLYSTVGRLSRPSQSERQH